MELHISDFIEHSLKYEAFHRSIALKQKVVETIHTCQNVHYIYLKHIPASYVILWGRYFFSRKACLQVPLSPIHLKTHEINLSGEIYLKRSKSGGKKVPLLIKL